MDVRWVEDTQNNFTWLDQEVNFTGKQSLQYEKHGTNP